MPGVRGLAPTDEFGMAAFFCGADLCAMEPVAGTDGVLRCPRCGHHTDAPGSGTLDDGFDVVHRQWGLRGDPHAWRALRERVAGVATPVRPDDVRDAYVAGLRDVAGVDVDQATEGSVYRAELDQGGMSGGHVSVDWWRAKGIPLLTARAVARRPPDPARGWRRRLVDVAVWALLLAIPAALIGGGVQLLYERGYGTRAQATVLECNRSGGVVVGVSTGRTECLATWTLDGEVTIGRYANGDVTDVGDTISVTVRGDTAYRRSLGLPILLIALGTPFLALPVLALVQRRR